MYKNQGPFGSWNETYTIQIRQKGFFKQLECVGPKHSDQ